MRVFAVVIGVRRWGRGGRGGRNEGAGGRFKCTAWHSTPKQHSRALSKLSQARRSGERVELRRKNLFASCPSYAPFAGLCETVQTALKRAPCRAAAHELSAFAPSLMSLNLPRTRDASLPHAERHLF